MPVRRLAGLAAFCALVMSLMAPAAGAKILDACVVLAPEELETIFEQPFTKGTVLQGELPRPTVVLDVHPDDAAARDLQNNEVARMFNDLGEVRLPVRVTPAVRRGTVAMPKGVWRRSVANGFTSNALVPDTLTDLGGGACFNDARVQIEKVTM
jgi:hypothetical protein